MIYHSEKAIFIKIAERLCDDILAGLHQEGDRIPSIRELAGEYEVNTNTVLRAFDILQRDDI
ncbi:MAG: winged helix-turn-helix transcriptional regulator, partial [Prevotella sp.]|nr:winged helix-turn-helix transcriptional regulator [Prevotella sp.]